MPAICIISTNIMITITAQSKTCGLNLSYPYLFANAPSPPPPMVPAIAEYPISVIIKFVTANINCGNASGIRTFVSMLKLLAPIDFEASMIPLSTFKNSCSNNLAKNGIAPIVNGTIEADVPIFVPTIIFDNGSKIIINIMNGNDLVMLTMTSNTEYSFGFGFNPVLLVVYNTNDNGSPMSIVKIVLTIIIYKVSVVASNNKLEILSIYFTSSTFIPFSLKISIAFSILSFSPNNSTTVYPTPVD